MLVIGRVAAALLSGVLLAQAHGLQPYWPLAWAAAIPLLVAVIGASRMIAFLCGAIAGALSVAGMFAYMLELTGPAPLAVIVVFKALIWGGAALAASFAERRLPAAAAVFVFPALMAGVETLIAAVSPHGTAGAFAYSQMDFLPAIQVASLGGAPAITFVVMLFASAVALLIAKRALVSFAAPALIIAAALGWGYMRAQRSGPLAPPSNPGAPSAVVTMLASDQFEGIPDDWRAVWNGYAAQIERAADQDHRVVVLPEKIAHLTSDEAAAAIEQIAEIARRRDLLLVVGVDEKTAEGRFNRAYVLSPNGARTYDKRHMIPGLEAEFVPGPGDLLFEHDGLRYGVAICKDMDFAPLGRGYAGVDVMLVPAWDFVDDAWLHGRVAILRGVENGYSVVRSAREGALTVSDAYGRVTAETPSGPQTAFNAEIPRHSPGPTLYSRIGDAFGWAMLALAALLTGWAFLRRRSA